MRICLAHGFSISLIAIWGEVGAVLGCRVFGSTPGFNPLDACSACLQLRQLENVSRHGQIASRGQNVPCGEKLPPGCTLELLAMGGVGGL